MTCRGIALGLALCAMGCGANLPNAPVFPAPGNAGHAPKGIAAPGMDRDPAVGLQLYPGDVVALRRIAADTTEDKGLVVDEMGNLHVPLAGDVKVAGLSLTDAEKAVEEALRKFDRVTRVALVLETPAGQVATVTGAVGKPGRVPVTPGTRISDLLAAAGGPITSTEFGEFVSLSDLSTAKLLRDARTMPVSVQKASDGDPRHNIFVRPGDQLVVPARSGDRISMLGELRDAKPVAYRPGLRLTEALSVNQDITIDGDRSDIRIMRGAPNALQVYKVDLLAIVDGDAPDVVLAPGDVVYVTDHWIAGFGEVLERLGPILSIGVAVGTVALTVYLTK